MGVGWQNGPNTFRPISQKHEIGHLPRGRMNNEYLQLKKAKNIEVCPDLQ